MQSMKVMTSLVHGPVQRFTMDIHKVLAHREHFNIMDIQGSHQGMARRCFSPLPL